jgi:hypothetical protein
MLATALRAPVTEHVRPREERMRMTTLLPRSIRALLLVTCFVFVAGCQAMMYGTADDLNRIKIGMSRADVIATLGEPMTTSADAATSEERLTYKRMAYTLGWSPTLYDVVLKQGRVVRYGAQP